MRQAVVRWLLELRLAVPHDILEAIGIDSGFTRPLPQAVLTSTHGQHCIAIAG
jgi:hypothetical protein